MILLSKLILVSQIAHCTNLMKFDTEMILLCYYCKLIQILVSQIAHGTDLMKSGL